jgi:phosphomannomutase
MQAAIHELMARTGVRFGTSGARGLATQLTDFVAYAYAQGFLRYLREAGEPVGPGARVAVGGDFRPSTARIMEAVMRAAEDLQLVPVNCGRLPSPALALHGLAEGIPTVMVTGSHIPADRNGLKFNKCAGEVLKEDEAGITRQVVEIPDGLFRADGSFTRLAEGTRAETNAPLEAYVARYLDFFPAGGLRGLRLGVYQHSAVGRDVLVRILAGLGAEVRALGRSETFVPVDTEAIRSEHAALARQWAAEYRLDAIASADGDSDRPLLSDGQGRWIRGDVAGILAAKFLEADSVSTPVSCNGALELSDWFPEVRRTRIGSPFVVAAMLDAVARGRRRVVGYEANGGFLLASDIARDGRTLRALPTRDAVILILALLLSARERGLTLAQLVATLPPRCTASGLLKACAPEKSAALLARFPAADEAATRAAFTELFGADLGGVTAVDRTDGVRATFANGEVIHLRPSGNAPEFRGYTEAADEARAQALNDRVMAVLARLAA